MFLIRLLMRLCFSWQYVLIIHYDGKVKIRRAKSRCNGWSVKSYRQKTGHVLKPQGDVHPSGHLVEWLPLTPPMRAIYHKMPTPPRSVGGARKRRDV